MTPLAAAPVPAALLDAEARLACLSATWTRPALAREHAPVHELLAEVRVRLRLARILAACEPSHRNAATLFAGAADEVLELTLLALAHDPDDLS
jgi:hypothetical protein